VGFQAVDLLIGLILLFLLLVVAKWLIIGIKRLFQRYNFILVMLYLFLLTPIALIHAFFLGVFGNSQDYEMERAIKDEVHRQLQMEKRKEASVLIQSKVEELEKQNSKD
tara:strand:+ start:393 stop:719 length:327 start_codon:yes stop_codon:yes gene_type:complete